LKFIYLPGVFLLDFPYEGVEIVLGHQFHTATHFQGGGGVNYSPGLWRANPVYIYVHKKC